MQPSVIINYDISVLQVSVSYRHRMQSLCHFQKIKPQPDETVSVIMVIPNECLQVIALYPLHPCCRIGLTIDNYSGINIHEFRKIWQIDVLERLREQLEPFA